MSEEYWDLYDRSGNNIHRPIKRGEPIPEGAYNRIVHVWIRMRMENF